ncbi:MAG: hypothetical protein WDM81_11490 [Rhizomicrobium sp.]
MAAGQFSLRGSRENIENFLAEVRKQGVASPIEATFQSPPPSILSRNRQHQVELVDCVVNFGLGVISAGAYDAIKIVVYALAHKNKLILSETSPGDKTEK